MNKIDDRISNIIEQLNNVNLDLNRLNQSYQGTIEELKWQISEIDKSRNIWYNKCKEYEEILFSLGYFKINKQDLPF